MFLERQVVADLMQLQLGTGIFNNKICCVVLFFLNVI